MQVQNRLQQHSWRLAMFALVFASSAVHANALTVNLSSPNLDQWSYPFAGNPGGSSYASVFGGYSPTSGFHPDFDNRDSQLVIGFNTATAGIVPNLGQWAYTVESARVSITVESNNSFLYDTTSDSYRIWLPPSHPDYQVDSDPGHAVELFGTGFRNGFTANSYGENAPYSPMGSFGKGIRSAFPIAFVNGHRADVSNNFDQEFDPMPFAVGLNANLTPGQPVPANTVLRFQIDVSQPDIHRYVRRSLHAGMLDFNIASIFPAEQQQSGTYPRFFTKENIAVQAGIASAARLEITVNISKTPWRAGDVNGDGLVNVTDLLAVINAWGPCPMCAADVNYDSIVNVSDLLIVINTWGSN